MSLSQLSDTTETETERLIVADPEWIAGLEYGKPRRGHPEGSVENHIPEVLANVDRVAIDPEDRARLRLVALTHDNFKYQVDKTRDRTGENRHGWLARHFAERYITDVEVLEVIELHDEGFLSWKKAISSGKLAAGTARAERLIDRLGLDLIPFYLRFFRADNETGDKTPDSLIWFTDLYIKRLNV